MTQLQIASQANVARMTCRVCGGERVSYLCRTFNEHSGTQWLDNYRCKDCGSVFVGNPIAAEELAEAYGTMDEAAYYRETAEASAQKFENVVRDLAAVAAPSASMLDVGGGNAALVRALAKHGFTDLSVHEIPGADLTEESAVPYKIYRDTDYSTIPSAAFDVITMMDVMEHVPDPDGALTAARRALKPRGYLYLHTPAVTALDRAMHLVARLPIVGSVGRAWQRARTSIFHLQNYTPRALRLLAERHGFEIVRLECINELSWPISRYVRVYLVEKRGVPPALGALVSLILTPIVRSRLNPNKAVMLARVRS